MWAPDLRLETPVDLVKQDEDLLHIIRPQATDAGVTSAGPLGLATSLPGDVFGDFNSPLRGQNNRFEGLYLDDFIIGFAERGERIRHAANQTAFVANPQARPIDFVNDNGPYQLEIRRGTDSQSPVNRSFDTNDRLAQGITLVIHRGLDIADGQTFTISDGVQHIVYEYVDTSIAGNQAQAGHIAILFAPADPDYVVAQRVRDAINGGDSQAVLDITASIADGTILGSGDPQPSTSGRVNLFGPATLTVQATDVRETNDTLADATPTGITGIDSPSFTGNGYLGDNPNFPLQPSLDVDMYSVALAAGETLRIDVDANEVGSELDAMLRIFDASGRPLALSDDTAAPGELSRLDPYLRFTPAAAGTYYVGVSSYNNRAYDPTREGSGVAGTSTGFYQIKMTFGAFTGSDYILYDEVGDPNNPRDQGQLLIQHNTITNSSGYAITAEPGTRDGQNNDIPHPGPVRNTPKLNTGNLAPGVVIENNVVAFNQTGGIRVSGDPNGPGLPTASVPFARVINNTVYGGLALRGSAGPDLHRSQFVYAGGDADHVLGGQSELR